MFPLHKTARWAISRAAWRVVVLTSVSIVAHYVRTLPQWPRARRQVHMDKTGKKSLDMKHVSFRMPADVHHEYLAVAQSRGVDLSAVLNWVLIEMLPVLVLRRAEHAAAMLRAVGVNLPQGTGAGPNPQET